MGSGLSDAQVVNTDEARKLHDDLLAGRPEGARHDVDICVFCLDKAKADDESQRSGALPSSDGPDVSEEHTSTDPNTKGGTTDMSDTLSKETHEALLAKAVADATADLSAQLTTVTAERDELAGKNTELAGQVETLTADNTRVNAELDSAQVKLTAATEEVASLKSSIEEAAAKAAKTELASKRAEQVKALGLFTDEYVGEKAEIWADLAEDVWGERLSEWQLIKPAGTDEASTKKTTETASALSGTTGDLTKEPPVETASATKPPARRAVLGLS